jgi:two-component system, NtrC family, response regulator AlgB
MTVTHDEAGGEVGFGTDQAARPATLNVLVVDDEPNIRKALAACLESEGHRAVTVGTANDALQATRRRSFDLAFVDLRLGSDHGMDLIPALRAENPWLKVVVITAYAAIDTAVESIRRGASDYLPKPFTPAQVGVVTQKVAELRGLEQKVAGSPGRWPTATRRSSSAARAARARA